MLPCPSPTPRARSNSCPPSRWCHPTISSSVVPFSSTFNLSQHQGLLWWVSSSHQVAEVLELQLQHQSFQWICRTEYLKHSCLLIWRMYMSTQALPVESWHLGVCTWCLDGGLGQSCRILQLYLPCSPHAVFGGCIIKEQRFFPPWLHKVKNVRYFHTPGPQLLQALKIT